MKFPNQIMVNSKSPSDIKTKIKYGPQIIKMVIYYCYSGEQTLFVMWIIVQIPIIYKYYEVL